MSCSDNILEDMGNGIFNLLKKLVTLNVNTIKLTIKGVKNGVNALLNGATYIYSKMDVAIQNMEMKKQINEEIKRTNEYLRVKNIHDLMQISYKNIATEREKIVFNDDLSSDDVFDYIEIIREEINRCEEVKEYVFPQDLYQEMCELTSINLFNADLTDVKQRIKKLVIDFDVLEKQGHAVVLAVQGKVYESNEDNGIDEKMIEESYKQLVGIYKDFENKLKCKNNIFVDNSCLTGMSIYEPKNDEITKLANKNNEVIKND